MMTVIMRAQFLLLLLLLGLLFLVHSVSSSSSSVSEECPQPDLSLKTKTGGESSKVKYKNKSPVPLVAFWIHPSGSEKLIDSNVAPYGGTFETNTYVGHVFRFYYDASFDADATTTTENYIFVTERQVIHSPKDSIKITVDDICQPILDHFTKKQELLTSKTDTELKSLMANPNEECLPPDDSTKWSCVRVLTSKEYQDRLTKYAGIKYGYNSTLEATPPDPKDLVRQIGDTSDTIWLHQIPKIPRVSLQGPGYQKMDFTPKLKELLLPFYSERKIGGPQDSTTIGRIIPGGFTNSHTVPMSMLSLDQYPEIKRPLIEEMQRILEWWTYPTKLIPTSTFGIRIYHNQSMLINHVDRADTHVASAVIQVGQSGMVEGWPLEIIHNDDGSCSEVYLQPGQLVLYEGARFLHGRPMRLQGVEFANIFSHFRPSDWYGPGKSPNYDGLLNEDGYVIIDDDDEEEEEL